MSLYPIYLWWYSTIILTIQIKLSCRAKLIIEFDYKCFHAELEATCYKKNDQANGAFARDVVKDNKVNENQDNKNDEANGAFAPVVKDNKVNENQDNLPGNPNDQQGMYI